MNHYVVKPPYREDVSWWVWECVCGEKFYALTFIRVVTLGASHIKEKEKD